MFFAGPRIRRLPLAGADKFGNNVLEREIFLILLPEIERVSAVHVITRFNVRPNAD